MAVAEGPFSRSAAGQLSPSSREAARANGRTDRLGQFLELAGQVPAYSSSTWTGRDRSPTKDNGKFTAADVEPGLVSPRFYDAKGAAAPLPFFVGTLPSARRICTRFRP